MSFTEVDKFEKCISEYFNSPYGVAVDSCTHAIELCLRLNNSNNIKFPKQTYVGVPQLGFKLNLNWSFGEIKWRDFYFIENTNIIDAAVLWKKNSYIKNTFMCISFQYQKHLNMGRGGMILTDNESCHKLLKKMSYDGRLRDVSWRSQNIDTLGYHYYMPPESASKGIELFNKKKDLPPKKWTHEDYPDLSNMIIFSKK
jgi:dTDP-4-amino-4,6-dideoxygalactose transaminase